MEYQIASILIQNSGYPYHGQVHKIKMKRQLQVLKTHLNFSSVREGCNCLAFVYSKLLQSEIVQKIA